MKGRPFPVRKVVSIVLLFVGFVVANWGCMYREVSTNSDQKGFVKPYEDDLADVSKAHLLLAGWPQTFYFRVQYDDLPSYSRLSWKNLAINLAIWLLVIVGFILYENRLERLRNKNGSGVKRQLTVVDLLACTAILAGIIAYWQSLQATTAAEAAVGAEIAAAGGSSVQKVFLPETGINVFPYSVRWTVRRVTEVTLEAPNSELLTKAIALPYLTRLNIGGGEYDLKLLNRLAAKPLLSSLRISGRRLDSQAIASIAAIKQLQALNLMRTNVTVKALEHFSSMPRLQSLNLIHTDVQLAEIGPTGLSKTLRTLALPHPAAGRGDHLTLEDWPELQRLACNEYDERINAEAVTLELKQLPRLRQVSLDGLQAFDLQFDQLPELAEIGVLHAQWETRASQSEVVPAVAWIRKLSFGSLPALRLLKLHAPSLQQMRFSQPMAMRLELKTARMQEGSQRPTGDVIPAAQIQGWLSSWQKSVGPNELSLATVSLQDVDLTALAQCENIRKLDLSYSSITPQQIRKLSGMKGLEELNVDGGILDGESVAWLVANLPDLRRLPCNPLALGRLKLENNAKLEQLWSDPGLPLVPIDALRVAAMPKLAQAFDLPAELWYLQIEDAPSLTGLSMRSPWPEKAILKGLRDLKYFAAGGPRLDDSAAEVVLACEKLDALTLAYSSVSPATLAKIGTLKNLTYLALSGSRVNDEVVSQWQPLPSLRTLRLDDTAITDKSIDFILGCANLERLSLSNTQVTAQGLARLSAHTKLSRIDCGGTGLSAEKLSAVCGIRSLAALDLSDANVTAKVLAALQQDAPGTFDKLILRNSQVDSAALVQLARNKTGIIFDLTDSDVDPNALAALGTAERVMPPTSEEDDAPQLLSEYAMRAAMKQYGVEIPSAASTTGVRLVKGQIEPRLFSPDALAANAVPSLQTEPADAFRQPSAIVMTPPMSFPAVVGYVIGNISKAFSEFGTQGGDHVDEY